MPLIRTLLLSLLLVCTAALAHAETASPFGIGTPGDDSAAPSASPGDAPSDAPAGQPSFLRKIGVQLVMLQSRVNRAINAQLMAIKTGDKPWALWGGLLIGFLYGVFHALGPGHGKSVIVGYFLGREAHPLRGIAMASWISFSHVVGAIVIVTVVHFILAQSLASPVDEVDGLRVFSYGAILLIGLAMIWQALRGGGHAHAHAHHGHDHAHGEHCAHVPGARPGMRKEQGLLGFAAGFIPCSGAILILVFALTNGIVLSGIAMTLAIAVGMAITLSVMGVASILVRRQIVLRLPESTVASRAFSLLGPILVTAIGAVLLCGALLLPTAS
jgi:ABC-type nickel/cobalt efflux system permease component RcnA